MNEAKLQTLMQDFIRKDPSREDDHGAERKRRRERYQSIDKTKLLSMTETEFSDYIGDLWANQIWRNNKAYIADKLIADNGFGHLKKQLAALLYGNNPIEDRWDAFLSTVKGMGPAMISELLSYVDPRRYMIFNKTTVRCFSYLGVQGMPRHNYQYTGQTYAKACGCAKELAGCLAAAGAENPDLLTVDYFLWDEILPLAEEKRLETPVIPPKPRQNDMSLHEELKEKLVAIGEFLGYESRPEVQVATGAVVDVVWEIRIGNRGKAIYVFEVQSKGSKDSAIMNLKRAQQNPAVQAVIAVSDRRQLDRIAGESKGVIEENTLRLWDCEDVLVVHDALARAQESMQRLSLVPDSF